MSEELCQRCGVESPDLRTLWTACFYDMSELGLPFNKIKILGWISQHPTYLGSQNDVRDFNFYSLRVCKPCRADWMRAIKTWFEEKPAPEKEDVEAGAIYVRELGANKKL